MLKPNDYQTGLLAQSIGARISRQLAPIIILLSLIGCGQKGPLVLPQDQGPKPVENSDSEKQTLKTKAAK